MKPALITGTAAAMAYLLIMGWQILRAAGFGRAGRYACNYSRSDH